MTWLEAIAQAEAALAGTPRAIGWEDRIAAAHLKGLALHWQAELRPKRPAGHRYYSNELAVQTHRDRTRPLLTALNIEIPEAGNG